MSNVHLRIQCNVGFSVFILAPIQMLNLDTATVMCFETMLTVKNEMFFFYFSCCKSWMAILVLLMHSVSMKMEHSCILEILLEILFPGMFLSQISCLQKVTFRLYAELVLTF